MNNETKDRVENDYRMYFEPQVIIGGRMIIPFTFVITASLLLILIPSCQQTPMQVGILNVPINSIEFESGGFVQ